MYYKYKEIIGGNLQVDDKWLLPPFPLYRRNKSIITILSVCF